MPRTTPRCWSPTQTAATPRSQAQRHHDALIAGLRALFASGDLGSHNGLPVSIVVTTTLQDLEAAEGRARTGGAPGYR
nr:DUF222 domain-containing protein [Mycobacterium gordonae]